MEYFSRFPKVLYPYKGKLTGEKTDKIEYIECTDIMIRLVLADQIIKNPLAVYNYRWREGDRPDKVAKAYYGDADFAWLVMLSGGLFDWYGDLPKGSDEFQNYINSEYGSIEIANDTIHHYEDEDGFTIDEETFDESTNPNKKAVSAFEYEDILNTKKTNVKLVSKQFIGKITDAFEKQIKQISDARKLSGLF